MNGASLTDIAEILGHKTLAMVKRYAHLSEGHVSQVVAAMNAHIFPTATQPISQQSER
jgi:site-specific recombinase XerD